MLVVHVVWHDELLWVWARGEGASDASAAELDTLLGVLPPVVSGEARLTQARQRSLEIALRLPAAGRLEATTVPAVPLGPSAALSFLTRGLDDDGASCAGATLHHARAAAVLAARLAARGRLLPALRVGTAIAHARWEPAPTEADDTRLEALAGDQPPAFRCAVGAQVTAREALDGLVGALLDEIARSALTGHLPERPGGSPVVWRWLEALGDPSGTTPDLPTTALVAGRIDAWWQSSAPGQERAQLCLRIAEVPGAPTVGDDWPPEGSVANPLEGPGADDEPPVSSGGRWSVEAGLVDAVDPETYWSAAVIRGGVGPVRTRRGPVAGPAALLDTTLAGAARVWGELAALHGAHARDRFEVDAPALAEALRRHGTALEQLGIVIRAPRWMRQPSRLAARLHITSSERSPWSPGLLGASALVDYRWQVTLDGGDLTQAEMALLASATGPFTQVRGQWVSLTERDRAAAATLLERPGADGSGVPVVEALHAALSRGDELGDLPFDGMTASGWVAALLDGDLDLSLEAVPPPAGFSGVLRPYQLKGLSWLVFLERLSLGACLADDMGLGKTIQLLALLAAEREADDKPTPTLLVCPMSVVGNWQHESRRFTPGLRVYLHHGPNRTDADELAGRDDIDLVVTSYGVLARDVDGLAATDWWRVVLDEAQAVKNPTTAQAQAVRRLRAPRRVALTGTPIENRLGELHSIMRYLNPGLLGTAAGFQRRFAVPIERSGDDEARSALRALTKPFVLRRRKTDQGILDELPPKQEMKIYCNLTREQAALYRTLVDRLLSGVDSSVGIARRGMVLATLTRLKQVCNHPAHLLGDGSPLAGRSGKLAVLEEVLEEALGIDEKAVVFTQYAQLAHLLAPYLSERLGAEVAVFHGGLSRTARDTLRERFDAPDGPPVLLASLRAGGVGINLTAANHVVHLDRWWNPAVEQQATDRTHRIGQTKVVQVRTLICTGTLEERIDALLEKKSALAETIVGTDESWLTEMSTRDLRELLTLSADAVSDA
ncbi:MAG TPA: DEAD/DEAH box helicase [Mycobacteriales bacterium]|nr:DEAD/DEAH box helicase [Mycobacteriales bacterium]